MTGMNAATGRRIDGIEHIRQSVTDILTTPIGSRIMRRTYGSLIPELIDQPLTDATLLRAYAACVMAIIQWEPRINVTAVEKTVAMNQAGTATLLIHGRTKAGDAIQIAVNNQTAAQYASLFTAINNLHAAANSLANGVINGNS